MAIDYTVLKKGGFMRQRQKDYFSLRLRVVGGNVTAGQLEVISKAAEKYGRGYVHFTSRQSVEIPFIHINDVENIKADLAAGGVEPGVCGPRVRTVTACQGSEICPSGCAATMELAKELDRRYYGKELPHKFKFGITGCQNNCLKAEENDVGFKGALQVKWNASKCIFCGVCVKACRTNAIKMDGDNLFVDYEKCNYCGRCAKSCPTDAWDTESGYIMSFGGLFGNSIEKGRTMLPVITGYDTLMKAADTAVDFFIKYGKPSERFKFTIDRIGWDIFEKTLEEAIMDDYKINSICDITDVVCPVTFVKAKVALEELQAGQILSIKMNDGEPVQNVPRSIKEEGHQILKLEANDDGTYNLIVRKNGEE